jgi:hypothetical protein
MGWQDNAYPICNNCKSEAKAESWRAEDFIFDETKLANFPNGDREHV